MCFDIFLTRFNTNSRFAAEVYKVEPCECQKMVRSQIFDTKRRRFCLTRFDTMHAPLQPNANNVKNVFDTRPRANIF